MNSYRIILSEAVELVRNFVDHPSLGLIGKDSALGATINPTSIYGEPSSIAFLKANFEELYNGHMAWFCWNDTGLSGYPNLFLSYEQNDSYRKGTKTDFPDMPKLKRPREVFTLPSSVTDISVWLSTHQISPTQFPNQYEDVMIERPMVIQLARNFLQSSKFNAFNKFNFNFFENQQSSDVKDFLKTPGLAYIRYYFGYDPNPELDKANHIRIVLIAVDSDGKNIVTNTTDSAIVMLQHSWPPPPYQ